MSGNVRPSGGVDAGDAGRLTRWMLPWGAQAVAALLLLGPAVIGGRVLFWGTPLLQFVPWREYAIHLIRSGEWPLWNPLLGMGAPLLANYQSAILYPPNWLLFLVDVAWGQGLLVILHWIIAGTGMALLARHLGLRRVAATVSGLAYSLSGYLVARAGFFSINAAASWLPWVLVAVDRLATSDSSRGGSIRSILLAAVVFTMQWLAGHAQTAWYTLLFALVWLAWRAWERDRWRGLLSAGARALAALALAFALSAPQLLPTMEYLAQSPRAVSLDRDLAMTYSFWPWRAVELLAPGLLGHPARLGGYWGYGNYWEDAIYIGVLPGLLALAALASSLRRGRHLNRFVGFLGSCAAIAFLLGLGQNTPIFPFLFDHIPTFNLFQAPTRWNLITVACLSLLAGIGADRWRPAEGRWLYWLRLGTAGSAAVSLAAVAAGKLLPEVRPSTLRATAIAGGWLAVSGVLALLLRPSNRPWWRWLVPAVVATNLLVANAGVLPTADRSLYSALDPSLAAIPPGERLYIDPEVEYELKFAEAFRFDRFGTAAGWRNAVRLGLPNTPLLDRIASTNNFDPFVPATYQAWMQGLADLPLDRQVQMLSLMNVGRAWLVDGMGYQAMAGAGRARWYPDAVWVAKPNAALSAVMSAGFDPSSSLVLEGSGPDLPEGGTGEVVSVSDVSASLVRIRVRADGAGWLQLSDMYYPGWKATVDGRAVDIYRADSTFRAVHLLGGEHIVEFDYRPLVWRVGLLLCLAGIVAVCGLTWRELRT